MANKRSSSHAGRSSSSRGDEKREATQDKASGNFADDRERASEAGRKGGKASGGGRKSDS